MRKKIRAAGIAAVGVAIGIIAVAAFTTPTSSGTVKDETTGKANTSVSEIPLIYRETTYAEDTESTMPSAAQSDIEMLAKLIWGEARGVKSTTEKAAVIWCVLNRVDADGYACGGDIEWVVTYPGQFGGHSEDNPLTEDNAEIAEDVLNRWLAEKAGCEDAGRVLPKEYIYFQGDGERNHFTTEWESEDYWDWSLDSPYED